MNFEVRDLEITAETSGGEKHIVSNLSFRVKNGESLAIVGNSGCGKTMTALSALQLLPENCRAKGEILLNGNNLLKKTRHEINKIRGTEIVYIPQNGADFLNPCLKIKTQIYESLKKNGARNRNERREKAKKLLINVGLSEADEILNKYPFQLSGGQAQRVVLAISLCANAALVIADEPTKGIDNETANKFLDKLQALFYKTCVIIITHNISVARRCENILVMNDGHAVEYGKSKDVLTSPKSEYTAELLKNLPCNLRKKNA